VREPSTSEATTTALRAAVIGSRSYLELELGEVDDLKRAMNGVFELLEIEQKFDVLFENFIELEQTLAAVTIGSAYKSGFMYEDFFDEKRRVNRRIINMLTAGRLYIEQSLHHVGSLYPGDAAKLDEVKALFRAEHASNLGYRVLEALRNYVQHRGLPTQSMTLHSEWIDRDTERQALHSNISVSLKPEDLRADGKFKASVLAEVEAIGDVVDIKLMIRQYLDSLGRVHETVREMTRPLFEEWKGAVGGVLGRFEQRFPEEPKVARAVVDQQPDGRRYTKRFEVFDEPFKYIETLRGRNRSLSNVSKRFVSTRQYAKGG
jgi:hypothetical protein